LGVDYSWQIDGQFVQADGYVEPRQVEVSFYNRNNSGQIADPDAFENIVQPASTNSITGYLDKFVYFQLQSDGVTYNLVDSANFAAYPTPNDVSSNDLIDGGLYYFYDPSYNVVNTYSTASTSFVYDTAAASYVAYSGRDGLKFQYTHNTSQNTRIDPSKSNIIDVYLLTSDYDTAFRNWVSGGAVGSAPLPQTSAALEDNYSASLEPIKTISDEIVYQPVKYKVLFGPSADSSLQAIFKAVQSPTSTLSSNDIKSQILIAINKFFALENWDFGQSFYFSELSTYVMNLLSPDITNFVVVPANPNSNFGSFYEVACQSNEIFISSAVASNIQVISAITAAQLNTTNIVTQSGI